MTAEEWLAHYCKDNNIDWAKLSEAELFQLSMIVPCTIRCFRVGGAIDALEIGEKCPECGKPHSDPHLSTRFDAIRAGVLDDRAGTGI